MEKVEFLRTLSKVLHMSWLQIYFFLFLMYKVTFEGRLILFCLLQWLYLLLYTLSKSKSDNLSTNHTHFRCFLYIMLRTISNEEQTINEYHQYNTNDTLPRGK